MLWLLWSSSLSSNRYFFPMPLVAEKGFKAFFPFSHPPCTDEDIRQLGSDLRTLYNKLRGKEETGDWGRQFCFFRSPPAKLPITLLTVLFLPWELLSQNSQTPAPEAEGEQISSLSAQPIPYKTDRWNRFFLSAAPAVQYKYCWVLANKTVFLY